MKVKLDENLPATLRESLAALGHNVQTAAEEGLGGKSDDVVWFRCQSEDRFLITQDLDFSDMRLFQPGSHHGLMLLRLNNPSRSALIARVRAVFQESTVDEWSGCNVIVTEVKLRILKPGGR